MLLMLVSLFRFQFGRTNGSEELDFSVLRANREKELESESGPETPKSRLNRLAEKACVVSRSVIIVLTKLTIM